MNRVKQVLFVVCDVIEVISIPVAFGLAVWAAVTVLR